MRAFTLGLVLVFSAVLAAGEAPPPDPLTLLPSLPKPKPAAAVPLANLEEFAPGVFKSVDRVVVDGHVIIDQGPPDGLEVTACLQAGKTHEATVLLDTGNGLVIKSAFTLAFGFADGQPPTENGGQPARGTPVRVQAMWRSPDDKDAWLAIDASCLVRDRVVDRAFPPLPFIYTGSRILAIRQNMPDGSTVENQRFMLDITKSLVVNYDEPDALLASPFPGAGRNDHRYEVNSGACPTAKTPIRLVFSRAELPLTVDLAADGALSLDGHALDDAALGGALGKAYGEGAQPALRAVGVRVAAATDHAVDVQAQARVLAAAAAAKAWVVPVFVLAP